MHFTRYVAAVALLIGGIIQSAVRADDFTVDPSHSSISFKIQHAGISWTHGRFNDVSGKFTTGSDNPSFEVSIKTDSIDTNNAQRDKHLKAPDFLNTKQFPSITFKSTAITPMEGGYKVTGDFTMHGVTKPLTLELVGGKKIEFPKGIQRTGFTTDIVLKRTEYGMDKFLQGIGDDVHVSISFEGTYK